MIDSHCHLEQSDYDKDRDDVIGACKKDGIKAIVTCSAHPEDLGLTLELVERYKDYVFATVSIHPQDIKDFSEKDVTIFFEHVREINDKIVGIGETGLDYNWVKEPEWHEKQKVLFRKFIDLSKDLNKPLVIHSRDAYEDSVQILEETKSRDVLMHMFGANQLVKKLIDNDWYVSTNTILLRSKKHKKIVRDMPLERILLETDSPWLGFGKRNDPRSIRSVAEKIAEIKKVSFNDVWVKCTENAIRFYKLPIKV